MSGTAGTHLRDQVAGLLGDLEDGARQAEFVVEGALWSHGRRERRKHHSQHVLRTGLARGAGQGDDLQLLVAIDEVPGQSTRGHHRVIDQDVRTSNGAADKGGRGTGGQCLLHVVVAVMGLTHHSQEQATGRRLSGVDDNRVNHRLRIAADQGTPQGAGDLTEGHRYHRRASNACWAATRSSKG